jgi:hypothetical protein
VNYCPSLGDASFQSLNEGGSTNFSLGFPFQYQNATFTSIQVNVNGFIALNGTALIYVYANSFLTNSTGRVFTRSNTSSSSDDLTAISTQVRAAYPANYFTFTARWVFVVTWSYVSSVSAPSQLPAGACHRLGHLFPGLLLRASGFDQSGYVLFGRLEQRLIRSAYNISELHLRWNSSSATQHWRYWNIALTFKLKQIYEALFIFCKSLYNNHDYHFYHHDHYHNYHYNHDYSTVQ